MRKIFSLERRADNEVVVACADDQKPTMKDVV
jgi:hypothetical protein